MEPPEHGDTVSTVAADVFVAAVLIVASVDSKVDADSDAVI